MKGWWRLFSLMLMFLFLHDDTPINEKLQSNAYYTITVSFSYLHRILRELEF